MNSKLHPGLALIACTLAGHAEANARIRDEIQEATAHDAEEIFGRWLSVWRAVESVDGVPLSQACLYHKIKPEELVEVSLAIDRIAPHDWSGFVDDSRNERAWGRVETASLSLSEAFLHRRGDPNEILEGLALLNSGVERPSPAHCGKDLGRLLADDLEARHKLRQSGKRTGIATGFGALDHLTDGLQLGELAIVGARPSAGKTALACSIVSSCCLVDGVPSVVLSLESSAAAITRRLAAANAGVRLRAMRDGTISEGDSKKIFTFLKRLKAAPIHILDDRKFASIDAAIAELSRLIRKHGIRLIVIDYAQKLKASGRHEKLTYGIGEVTSKLQAFAQRFNVAILALAQLNREPERDKGRLPRMSDLADSAQIERDADLVALLHRPRDKDPKGPEATLFVAKQRDGEVGPVKLRFAGEFARFENPGIDE